MNLDEIGLPFSTGRTLELTEVWTCENCVQTMHPLSQNSSRLHQKYTVQRS